MLRAFTITIPTARCVDFVDLTPLLESKVEEAGIVQGIAHFIVKHTSAALGIQEVEPNLIEDFELPSLRRTVQPTVQQPAARDPPD